MGGLGQVTEAPGATLVALVINERTAMNTEESELSLLRVQRVYEYTCKTLDDHEKTCGVCAYWVKQREDIRCAEYRELQLKRDTWHQLAKVIAWDQHGGVLGEY